MLSVFWRIIFEIDSGFLEWMKTEHDRHVRLSRPTEKKVGNRTTSLRHRNR